MLFLFLQFLALPVRTTPRPVKHMEMAGKMFAMIMRVKETVKGL